MAIKDYITEIKLLTTGLLNDLKLVAINLKLSALLAEADVLLKSQTVLNDLSKQKRLKIGLLSTKILQYQALENTIIGKDAEILRLSKYRLVAVKLKLLVNQKIKTLFDVKLSNETHKDYSKFKTIATQFDFETADLKVYDSNKKVYDILLLAGTFGNLTISRILLPKSGNNNKPTVNTKSRWNK